MMENLLPNNTFYNELAIDYDEMISFDSAVEKKKNLLKNFINQKTMAAADIGCGSGVDSIALAQLGVNVTAFDPSTEILKVAKMNSQKLDLEIAFYNYHADQIPHEHNNQYEIVVALGNTFSNIPQEIFIDSLNRCYEILKPKGQLLIQVLNYDKILSDKKRIVNITEGKTKYFVRFYDFVDEQIVFNILAFNKNNNSDFKLASTRIYPHLSKDFISV
ncbi:MAG TPA: class I SAM-dependent methyltransferase, partial [Ignavibacteriaceae bacterium]